MTKRCYNSYRRDSPFIFKLSQLSPQLFHVLSFSQEKLEIIRKQSTDSKFLNLCLLVIQIHLSPVLPHKGLKKTSLLPAIGYSHSHNCLNEFTYLASAHKIIIFLFFGAHMSGGSSLNIFPSLGHGQEPTCMVNPA